MDRLEPLKDLNELNEAIHKKWIWGNRENYSKSCDYLQKVNFSIQDFNEELACLKDAKMKDIIYLIVLTDWIKEAVESFFSLLNERLLNGFIFENEKELKRVKDYFVALRSYAVAHPLSTNRHKKFELDGEFICIDVQKDAYPITKDFSYNKYWHHIDFDGLHANAKAISYDFVLISYSQSGDNYKFYKYITGDFEDIRRVAELYIDKLYALGRYLSKLKMRDYKVGGDL